jgi:hypothetical protein
VFHTTPQGKRVSPNPLSQLGTWDFFLKLLSAPLVPQPFSSHNQAGSTLAVPPPTPVRMRIPRVPALRVSLMTPTTPPSPGTGRCQASPGRASLPTAAAPTPASRRASGRGGPSLPPSSPHARLAVPAAPRARAAPASPVPDPGSAAHPAGFASRCAAGAESRPGTRGLVWA